MSEIWNFSPDLDQQVQLCIMAAKNDERNKWLKEFAHVKLATKTVSNFATEMNIDPCDSQETIQNITQKEKKDTFIEVQDPKAEISNELQVKNYEEIIESLETEFQSNFDFMVKVCMENDTFLSLLAQQLSLPTIEKLCTQIYDQKDINRDFLSKFFRLFLPAYVKREYNSCTLDFIIRGYKKYPLEFRELLKILVKDPETPTKVLHDYVVTLDDNNRSKLVVDIADFDLSSEEFIHNLFSIYNAYKDCCKNDRTQNCIQSMLIQFSPFCTTDRNFGRLFLAYLQAQRSMKAETSIDKLEKLLEVHRSPFKRLCVMLLKELMNPHDGNDSSEDGSE